jgi:DNA helicase II / ATP-dependent DNA helicase PcrA
MLDNTLLIATAGAGKTTFLIREALKINDGQVLILTYTNANESEIKSKILRENFDHKFPPNIRVQTWFTFLIRHGVKPYQGKMHPELFENNINGMLFTEKKSGFRFYTKKGFPVYWGENDFMHFYFSQDLKIYSDKLSKFFVSCNEKTSGEIINRLSRIYSHIFIDEVQDLAGYDLEILKLLFKSGINIILVGDPRQVIYLTHHESKHAQYKDGRITQFVQDKCKSLCLIDDKTLKHSHRNNKEICDFSSRLYPDLPPSEPCKCDSCRSNSDKHNGIYVIRKSDVQSYHEIYQPVILRQQNSIAPEWNFGKSKGLTFKRVLIYPTLPIIQYLKDGELSKKIKGKEVKAFDIAKFYVALTRPRYSVAIVYNYTDDDVFIDGIKRWEH